MDTTTLIQVIAGVLGVAVLAFLIYRRKHAKV
jgi:LPXTG-motif cell wall-anchored protein